MKRRPPSGQDSDGQNKEATQVGTEAERGRDVTGGEVLAIYMNGETLSNHKIVRARCGGSGRANLVRSC